MEISKNQVLKTAIEEVRERTGMTEKEILQSIVNDYDTPEKQNADQAMSEFLHGGEE